MDDYLTHMAENIFTPCDYSFGRFSVTSNWIKSRFGAYHRYPVKSRLQMICDDIRQHFKTDNFMDEPLPKSSDVLKSLNKMLKFKNTLALYKDFYKKSGISDKFLMPSAKTLEWCDVYPFMYFHASFHGLEENKDIHHLIVDEMQDYTPVQYKVINILYTCQKTILGDFGQFINPNHFNTLKDLRQLYEDAEYVELNKSYRSTYEIITFAGRIQNIPSLEPTPRHGKMPKLILCSTREEELNQICKVLDGFYESKNTTLGIILKTDNIAETYYDALSKDYDLHLISSDSSSFVNGISVTSIQMSKGLEFDQVIIPQVNCETYFTQWDRSLLYIACTRAMHQLSLTYTGELTPLIDAVNCFDRIN
ncbi:ATP-binding domain-containing protein [Aminipila terrae]|uniref:ATP-binding domain-containing protein n=1 Tax=Aminipila terrae TaxID=2697030 RepID=UPI002ED4E197